MKYNMDKREKGFTLLEILLVIAAIGILAAIVIVAINPTQQLGKARNAERSSEINTISNAIYQYFIDEAAFPTSVNEALALTNLPIANTKLTNGDGEGFNACGITVTDDTGPGQNYVYLSELVPTYIGAIPVDPSNPASNTLIATESAAAAALEPALVIAASTQVCTGYTLSKGLGLDGRITISAPLAELSETISIQR